MCQCVYIYVDIQYIDIVIHQYIHEKDKIKMKE